MTAPNSVAPLGIKARGVAVYIENAPPALTACVFAAVLDLAYTVIRDPLSNRPGRLMQFSRISGHWKPQRSSLVLMVFCNCKGLIADIARGKRAQEVDIRNEGTHSPRLILRLPDQHQWNRNRSSASSPVRRL